MLQLSDCLRGRGKLIVFHTQVSSALFCLRQRNTYRGSYPLISVNPMASLIDSSGHSSSSCHVQEPASHVYEIVESSRAKARKMVEVAMQVLNGHLMLLYVWAPSMQLLLSEQN